MSTNLYCSNALVTVTTTDGVLAVMPYCEYIADRRGNTITIYDPIPHYDYDPECGFGSEEEPRWSDVTIKDVEFSCYAMDMVRIKLENAKAPLIDDEIPF